MHLLLITNRLGARPWSTGSPVAPIARALTGRGHRVTVIADSIDDPDLFAGIECQACRTYEQTATAFPIRFPRWAAGRMRRIPHDRAISLTHRVPAPTWFPIDAPERAWLAHKRDAASPIAIAVTLARTPGLVIRVPSRVARPIAAPRALPLYSLLEPPSPAERECARQSIRSLLRIPDGSVLMVLSVPGSLGPRLDPLLSALAKLDAAPILAALVRDAFTLERRARAIGGQRLLDNLRILTTTRDIRPMLLAANAAVTPFRTSLTHRFAADALRLGTPALGAHGFRLPLPEGEGWGVGGDDPRVAAATDGAEWLATLTRSLTPDALARARAEAGAAGTGLTLDRVVDRLLADG